MKRNAKQLLIGNILAIAFLPMAFADRQSANGQDLPFQDKILNVLFNPKIQTELEISEEQVTKIREILTDIRDSQKEYGAQLKEFSQSGATEKEIQAKRQEFIAELEKKKSGVQEKAMDVLLPHQLKRLKQVTIQVMMRESAKQNKNQSGLLTKEMMAFLEIDEKQAAKIKNKSIELQKKMMEEFKQLQDKYRKELLKELTTKQRKKYEEATGDFFAR